MSPSVKPVPVTVKVLPMLLGTFNGVMPVTVWTARAVEEVARIVAMVRRRRVNREARR